VIDWDELRERLCDDDELVVTVIDLFVAECPGWLAAIVDAVAAADGERIRTSAHALKGAAGNLSAHAVAVLAGRLERAGREGDLIASTAICAELAAGCDRLLDTLRQPLNSR
jgi:HPt (histidine-containing phosphotransfer) domain-containing protein